jgi:hypothetical protein
MVVTTSYVASVLAYVAGDEYEVSTDMLDAASVTLLIF